MNTQLDNYKNVDKSTQILYHEKNTFKVFYFNNLTAENQLIKAKLSTNYIQLFFCLNQQCVVAINMEHCAVPLKTNQSTLVYFKDQEMNLLFNLSPNSKLVSVLISIEYFHSLFTDEGNLSFNFNIFKSDKPIIESKEISPTISLIINQLTTDKINKAVKPIYIKGKIYELLSFYFSTSSDDEGEHCPYIASEETIGKIKLAKEIIIKEMVNPPSLNQLAKKVGLNIKKLKTDFKEVYGAPVFTFLLNHKMELSKQLLQEQQQNVNEIAASIGYSSSSHFIAAFKKQYGITPKQYAKSL